ncbi:MAG: iron-only hydrogenase system regulator [Clostridiales bacterium]|nr:iron-only hydrogenase system regulator [Candidatus Crickella caballi]
METRLAIIGIIVEDRKASEQINVLLSEFAEYIKGRMGLPYEERNVSVISVVIDAPMDAISTLSGKLGALPGVSTKTVYSKK